MADRSGRIGEEGSSGGRGEKVKGTARQAQEKTGDVAAKAREKGGELAEEGREKAEELAHKAGDMARSRADEEKVRVAGGIRTVADALRRGSEDLPEDRRTYGRFVEAVADRAEGLSRYLEERDVDDMTREAQQFAREHTGMVVGGAFALGLLGARFLKSSSDQGGQGRWDAQDWPRERTYATGDRTAGGYPQTPGYEQPGGYSRGGVFHAATEDAPVRRERGEPGGGGLTGDRPETDAARPRDADGASELGRFADRDETRDRLGGP